MSLVSGTLVGLFGFSYIMYCKMSINAAEEESAEVLYLCLKYGFSGLNVLYDYLLGGSY